MHITIIELYCLLFNRPSLIHFIFVGFYLVN
jgi:hypothetical protein